MIIAKIHPESNWLLSVISEDGRSGTFDIGPYLEFEAFKALRDIKEFTKVSNGGYFVEWDCGADLSADTIEAKWLVQAGKPGKHVTSGDVPAIAPKLTLKTKTD
jgi:hypothetical protein